MLPISLSAPGTIDSLLAAHSSARGGDRGLLIQQIHAVTQGGMRKQYAASALEPKCRCYGV